MKIWFFNHYALPPNLHPLTRTYNFAKGLKSRGHTPVVFAASTLHKTEVNLIKSKERMKIGCYEDIKYVYVRARNYHGNGKNRVLNMFDYFFGLFKASKNKEKPDVIIASSVHPLTCVAGIKISKKLKCKCVVEIADLWPKTLIDFGIITERSIIAKILYKLELWIYRNADEIIFTMEGGKEYIEDTFKGKKIDLSKVHYINNGIDLESYNRDMNEFIFRDDDLDRSDKFKVIYTGSLGEANATHYIMEAAKKIKEDGYDNIQILIFGDGAKKNELEDYCIRYKLDNVIFKGKVEKKYIPSILSKGNLNVFTGKRYELYKYGLSLNKLFDYMASGKPIVSNFKSGYDNITKYNCGIAVDDEKIDSFAKAIVTFYEMDKEEYNVFCINSLNAAKEFDFVKLTDKLEDLLG